MSLNPLSRHGSKQLTLLCSHARRAYSTTSPYLSEPSTQAQSPAPATPPPPQSSEPATSSKSGLVSDGSGGRTGHRVVRDIPFEQLPYQCFQEARKVLAEDRAGKLKQIEEQKKRIEYAEKKADESYGSKYTKKGALMNMRRHLEWLKVQADINDPMIKKRFEDGAGDMSKPIYRFLADRKWRSYSRKLLMQRLTTMNVVPDLFSGLDPIIEVKLSFRQRVITPGEFVPSVLSTKPPALQIRPFDKGPRYYTVAVVDADVPDVETDGFRHRCHYLASNILVDPTAQSVTLSTLPSEHVVVDWLPPHAQKGSPYHRLCVFVYEQPGRMDPMERGSDQKGDVEVKGSMLDVADMKQKLDGTREIGARQLATKFRLRPVGAHMFRSTWDDWTASVMAKHNLPGADIELKRKRGEKLPPKKRDTSRYR